MEAVYAGLDIVALTSLNEGTPVALIEAQAANKPIIANNVGGVILTINDISGTWQAGSSTGGSITNRVV